jgi:hypothetical protein
MLASQLYIVDHKKDELLIDLIEIYSEQLIFVELHHIFIY